MKASRAAIVEAQSDTRIITLVSAMPVDKRSRNQKYQNQLCQNI